MNIFLRCAGTTLHCATHSKGPQISGFQTYMKWS